MKKLISFMHISLDGFVAGPAGEMDWIKVDEELFDHIGKRVDACDTAMYGRNTFEMMEGYWPTAGDDPSASKHDIEHSKWYKDVRKIVLSKSLQSNSDNVLVIDDETKVAPLKQQPGSEILLFGSPTATHSLIRQDLIDGYWLFVNPVILGKGIPLFQGNKERTMLELLGNRTFGSGVTEVNYAVKKQ